MVRGTGLGARFEGATAGEAMSATVASAAITLDAMGLCLENALNLEIILALENMRNKLVALAGDSWGADAESSDRPAHCHHRGKMRKK